MQQKKEFEVKVGPERMVLTDGLQPFAFKGAGNTVVVQAQLTFPPGYEPPARNSFPGLPGNAISRDGGQTWRRWKPQPEQDLGPVLEGSAKLLRDGTILLLDWIADVPDDSGKWHGQLWESKDNFETVQGPIRCPIDLPQAKMGYDDCGHPYSGVTLHRSLLELPDGSLLASAYCWFEGDDTPCPYQPTMNKFRVVVLRSTNRGRSWQYLSTVAVDPSVGQEGFNEPTMVLVSKGEYAGRLVCVMRTGSTDCPLYQAHSDDAGQSWSQPRALELHGVDPCLIELHDGVLALSSGRRMSSRSSKRRYYIAFSQDGGDTWSQVTTLPLIRSYANTFPGDNWGENSTETHYSSIVETTPGQVLFFYDVGLWASTIRYIATRTVEISA